MPWLICGDFNMIRYAHEKNNGNFRASEAAAFNDVFHALCLLELPLHDRQYTWSNRRDTPTLERLDRALFNLSWDAVLPNTTLSSLTRSTSDHVPLKITINTSVPKSRIFCFENSWKIKLGFQDMVGAAWCLHDPPENAAASLSLRLKRVRSHSKAWCWRLTSSGQREKDCKLVIRFLDVVEECRSLSPSELILRSVVASSLSRAVEEKILHWRQRSKVSVALEGDENSRFFHACASSRLRQNKIQSLEHDDVILTTHSQKERLLLDFYTNLLGSARETAWNFDLRDLYPARVPGLDSLDIAFTRGEIEAVFKHLDCNSSPGPDGFGPSFYRCTWTCTGPTLVELFESFFSRQAELERINRSYIVLLPKKETACTPEAFRPICLQNCPIKAITKALTFRLQKFIPLLVGGNQTRFVKNRCIAENYAYAMDLVHCCHARKAPTVLLKLDFHKAFDSVSWDSLILILRQKGFSDLWCNWMLDILVSGKSSILLNGVPGPWITCRNGLRQGDPISPYLFIIVADVLRQLLHHRGTSLHLCHPLLPGEPCPVLQYADDTIIFLQASSEAMASVKSVLDDFARATGLVINYSKTTFLPIALESDFAAHLASSLNTTVSSFPQPYLGLPLTPHKILSSDFFPLIASCDKYLAGWKTTLEQAG
ncbi:hypothetical protein U9M48_032914 [Paspalum notatum var. saurae]|uniref:Reverse transcriptase domain-containing protein n=1 Tax=Paspalum notatum var. saurae TaxID=547442 RepID=A0AAQ3U652_PASNO